MSRVVIRVLTICFFLGSLPVSASYQDWERAAIQRTRKVLYHPWSPAPYFLNSCAGALVFVDRTVLPSRERIRSLRKLYREGRDYFNAEKRFRKRLQSQLEEQRRVFVEQAIPRVRMHLTKTVHPDARDVFFSDFDPTMDVVFVFEPNAHSITYVGDTQMDYVGPGAFLVREAKKMRSGLLARVRLPTETFAKLKAIVDAGVAVPRYRAGSCQHAELSVLLKVGIKPLGGANLSGLANFQSIVLQGFEDASGNRLPTDLVYAHGNADFPLTTEQAMNNLYGSLQVTELRFLADGIHNYGVTEQDVAERIGRLETEFTIPISGIRSPNEYSYTFAQGFMSALVSSVRSQYGLTGNQLLPLVVDDFEGVDPQTVRQQLLRALDASIASLMAARGTR